MADGQSDTPSSLPEQYALKEKEEKLVAVIEAVDVKEPEKPVEASPEEVPVPLVEVPATDITPVAAEESTDATADEAPSVKAEDVSAAADAVEETTEASEEGNSGDAEATSEATEIKLETAPADFRFPTTNQTRHCFTRYIEYHRCVAAKGEDAPECDKFAKSYRSLCPGEWIDRWNEQRENGTFPGPL